MRLLLLAAVLAVAGVVGLWLRSSADRETMQHRRTDAPPLTIPATPKGPPPLPDLATVARADPHTARTQNLLARFVRTAPQRGAESVPLILALLLANDDVTLLPRWTYVDGHPDGFPSLRAAYIEALRAIPGKDASRALQEVLKTTRAAEEAYLLGLALEERRQTGWAPTVLRHAFVRDQRAAAKRIVALASRADPAGTAATMLERAPDAPAALEWCIAALPADHARFTTETAVRSETLPYKAKALAVRGLCNRAEIDGLRTLSEMAARGEMRGRLGLEAAYAMTQSPQFRIDALAYRRAVAERDGAAAAKARARFDDRMLAVRRYCADALHIDIATTDDARGKALERQLKAHRKALGE